MLLLDLVLLVVTAALCTWRLSAATWRPKIRMAAASLAALLAVGQWSLYGFTWQSVPAWLVLALSALPVLRTGALLTWSGRLTLSAAALAALAAWTLPAVPRLPPPDGPYAVATHVYRWTDTTRDEPRTPDENDRRSVIVQAWYPTANPRSSPTERSLPYLDGLERLPESVAGIPGFILNRYGQINTHARAAAPLASRERPWPVVIVSPGYGAPRAAYTGLALRLASRGFCVVVLDHPYEAAVTELPNGEVVAPRAIVASDRTQYMPGQQIVRTADIRFVMDQLARPLGPGPPLRAGGIQTSTVAVIGHSFGGAAAAMAMSEDSRVAAAANIDGTPYGDLPDRRLRGPLLLLQSDPVETGHGDLFIDGNRRLLAGAAPGVHYVITRANHYSFTDAPFYFSRPGRWLLAQVAGGGRGPEDTQKITADLLAAFLSEPLTGIPADLAATAAGHPDVVRVSSGSSGLGSGSDPGNRSG